MTALPLSSDFTGPVSEGDFKTAITALRDYQAGLLGTDGTVPTALATLGTLASAYLAKSAAYTVVVADRGRVIDATTGTWTLTLPTVATAGAGFSFLLRSSGTGVIMVDPAGTEQVDGATTLAVAAGRAVLLVCTGTAWVSHLMVVTLPANTISGNNTGSAATPIPLTAAQVKTLLGITEADVAGLVSDLALKAPLAAPTFTGAVNGTDLYLGSPNAILGMGAARISSQGTTNTAGAWNLWKGAANTAGPALAFGKSRGTAVDTYTIVAAADPLGIVEFWGADGTTMVRGGYLQAYAIGTPAAGDVRAGIRIATGGPTAGVSTVRLTVDDTTIAATLPITSAGPITQGSAALGAVAPGALALAAVPVKSVTPNATGTFTSTVPAAGGECTLLITTTGATSFTLTFGSGFVTSLGTIATGVTAGKKFLCKFASDGTSLVETARVGPY